MSGKDELLDKAIVEAKEAEDWQLVEWLRAARGSESAARWYSGKLRDANRVKRKLLNENAKLRELLQRLLAEYRYLRVRPRKMYLQHEQRMRAIEDEMCELGIEVEE